VHDLIRPVVENTADLVNGSRLHQSSRSQFKWLNLIGNMFFVFLIRKIFNVRLTDLLTGYRAFNRNVASMPLMSRGFDLETELTLKTVELQCRITEIPIDLSQRPGGSHSKISILSDGFLIFNTIFTIIRDYKPLTGFGSLGLLALIAGGIAGAFAVRNYTETLVIDLSMTLGSIGLVVLGIVAILVGIMLHTISRRFQQTDRHLMNILTKLTSIKKSR
jgi:hypothetical protein